MTPYERVQLSRQRTAGVFPLPSVLDCIRYAITELAEYDDALLRQERTGDKRNNDKAHDPRSELGQALYMLLSAAVQIPRELSDFPGRANNVQQEYAAALFGLSQAMSYAERWMNSNYPKLQFDMITTFCGAYDHICKLAGVHGWPVEALIDDTCTRFEAKHAPQEAA